MVDLRKDFRKMNLERYPLKSEPNKKWFEFYSIGPKGAIRKVVKFDPVRKNMYNLAFGDWDNKSKSIDSKIRSNNHDVQKVLTTVATVVMEFMEHYPDSILFAQGDGPEKTRLYQMAINRHLGEISYRYIIEGFRTYYRERFQPGRNYDLFALTNLVKN